MRRTEEEGGEEGGVGGEEVDEGGDEGAPWLLTLECGSYRSTWTVMHASVDASRYLLPRDSCADLPPC